MRVYKLKFNPNKTEILMVGPDSALGRHCDLILDGVVLPLKYQIHSLGILLDTSLLLVKQVWAVVRRA